MSILKMRVPLAEVGPDGKIRITLEWLKDLQAALAEAAAGIGSTTPDPTDPTTVDLTAINTAIASLRVDVNQSIIDILALTERVRKLEAGYQA